MSCPWVSRSMVAVVAVVVVTSFVATPAFARRPRPGRASATVAVLRMRGPEPLSAPRVVIAQASDPVTPGLTTPMSVTPTASPAPASQVLAPFTKALPATKASPKRALHHRARLSPIALPETPAPRFYERGWFWPVVGGIAAAIIVTIIVAESVGGDDRMPHGSLGTIKVTL